ncbi:MAG: asparagine synthase (glutamine-hydrolyzing) [Vicinamibacterales bacterium]
MCGICGELAFDRRQVSEQALSVMTATLEHRGPDHGATYRASDGEAGLGFRRLSIIDLRSAANQPIGNEDGRIQLVFNGEIYNYRDIQRGLVARGHIFRSNADSEVIVHLFEELGDRAVDELDGMFALAVWDDRAGQLTLARDRAGKKPLYVWRDARRVIFASETKAIVAHPDLRIEIEEDAIPSYFLYGYVPHPQTFYKGVRQIEPGSICRFDRDGLETARRYWQLRFPPIDPHSTAPPTRAAAAQRVRELVTSAVERRLMSDVPLGAFLSGGIDSTIVVGVMSRLLDKPVRTFSIGFEGDPAFDETEVARATAKRFGTRHTEFRVQPSAIDLLDTLVYHHDGAFADSSAIPTYLVSQLTRQYVTVALTGDGGDEVFAGYLRFGAAMAASRVPAWAGRTASAALSVLPMPRNERHLIARARRFTSFMQLPLQSRLTAWAGVFYDDLETLLTSEFQARVGAIDRYRHLKNLGGVEGASPLSQLLAANFHSYLHDDLLVKADRMSMANSLEARAPFLDRALIEYVAALPDDYKLNGRTTKVVLRDAFDDLVPEAVKRAPKRGFGVPIDAWFRSELGNYLRETLLVPSARLRDYVSQDRVRQLLDEHTARRANHGQRLWTLLTFERWLQLLPSWRTAA